MKSDLIVRITYIGNSLCLTAFISNFMNASVSLSVVLSFLLSLYLNNSSNWSIIINIFSFSGIFICFIASTSPNELLLKTVYNICFLICPSSLYFCVFSFFARVAERFSTGLLPGRVAIILHLEPAST